MAPPLSAMTHPQWQDVYPDVLLVGCDYDGPFEISIIGGHAKRCQVSDIILGKDAVGPSNPV